MATRHAIANLLCLLAASIFIVTRSRADDSATKASTVDVARIESYVDAQRQRAGIPGAALVIVRDGKIIHARGFGEASPGRNATPDTPFFIGSLSKSMTAIAVLQLVDAGKIDLDTPASKYLPWFRTSDRALSDRITVRELLTQTSGLSTRTGRELYVPDDAHDSILEHAQSLQNASLIAPPGMRFAYSNANYTVLGALIEAISSQKYGDFMRARVFDPLGMSATSTDFDAAKAAGLADSHRYFFGRAQVADLPYIHGEEASGYILSSANDLGRYLLFQLGENGSSILSPASFELAHRAAVPTGDGDSYAMGWYAWSDDGIPILSHDGLTPGHNAQIEIIPSMHLGFAILFDADGFTARDTMHDIRNGVTSIVLGFDPKPTRNARRYLLLVALLMLGIASSVRSLWMTIKKMRDAVVPTRRELSIGLFLGCLNVFVGFLIWKLVTHLADGPMTMVLFYQPDLGWAACVAAFASALAGLARLTTSARCARVMRLTRRG